MKYLKASIFCLLVTLFTLAYKSLPQASTPYETEHFDGKFTLSTWKTDGLPILWPTDGVVNQAIRLTDCASVSASNHCSGSGSSYGQERFVADNTNVHAGYVCPSGDPCTTAANGVGKQEETWYRFHVRLAPGYLATPHTQNALIEFHVDSRTEADAKAHGGVTAYSTAIEIEGQGAACPGSPAFCTTPGTQPRLYLQVPGGPTSNPHPLRFFPFALNSLLINHWYDFILHMIWSPTNGYVQWWVDGNKIIDQHTPTEYIRSDGTWSYADGLGLYNYRLWANWVSSVDGDEFVWGPTAASVGFGIPSPPTVLPPTIVNGHSVVSANVPLSWIASTSSGVTSYNVYRSITSGSGYLKIGSSSALSFIDISVKVGTTYYYVVTAVSNGVESIHSTQVVVTVQ